MKLLRYFSLFLLINSISIAGHLINAQQVTETTYLHCDRDAYLAGDRIYFALYLKGVPDALSRYAYILVRDQNNSTAVHVRVDIKNQKSVGSIPLPDTLKSGYYQILCYTNWMRNLENACFKKEIIVANRFDESLACFSEKKTQPFPVASVDIPGDLASDNESLHISPGKASYLTREKISFTLPARAPSGQSISSVSISVSEIIPGASSGPAISEWFEEIKSVYQIPSNEDGQNRFKQERHGAVLQGKIIPGEINTVDNSSASRYSSDGIRNYTILLSTVDTIPNLQYTKTDSDGSFFFNLDPYYDSKEVIVRLMEETSGRLWLDDKTIIKQPFIPSERYNIPGTKPYFKRSRDISVVQRYYGKKPVEDSTSALAEKKIIPALWYKKYRMVFPSDYVMLDDFFSISREILSDLKIRKIEGSYSIGFSPIQNKFNLDEEPGIFLDGVLINDVNQIIELGSKDIKSIETVPVVRYYGGLSFAGILSVLSVNHYINNIRFGTPYMKYSVKSSQPDVRPAAFDPASVPAHYPDFRQVLMWEPDFIPGGSEDQVIECYASDLCGIFRINIQGITMNGDAVSGSAVITIKPR